MLKICNHDIDIQSSIKYLGVYLDKQLTFKNLLADDLDKATKCGRALPKLKINYHKQDFTLQDVYPPNNDL